MDVNDTAWINRRDGAVFALASVLAAASWSLPPAKWPGFADRLARFRIGRRGSLTEGELAMIRIVVGDRPAQWINGTYWPQSLGQKYLSWMSILACYGPKRGQPACRLVGREHVDEALGRGRGVVLFTATFVHKDLMAKAAFAQAGYAVSHLSKDTHGFSETRFGKSWLNPVYTAVEERFLHERMVFSGSNTKAVIADVRDRLAKNRPVMITVTPLGRQVATRPFLHGRINIATGGLTLACENNASVLPVFTLREADGSMTTHVEEALKRPLRPGRAAAIDGLLDDYVPRLEDRVRRDPEQFSFPISKHYGKPLLIPSDPVASTSDHRPADEAAA